MCDFNENDYKTASPRSSNYVRYSMVNIESNHRLGFDEGIYNIDELIYRALDNGHINTDQSNKIVNLHGSNITKSTALRTKEKQSIAVGDIVVFAEFDQEAFSKAKASYVEESKKKTQAFYDKACTDAGLDPTSSVARVVYDMCWEKHHSSGYREVYNCMDQYVEFADKIIAAYNKDNS